MQNITTQHHETFESIKQTNEYEQEYWSARQLSKVLDYSQYRHFLPVIERAREACRNSHQQVENHMEDVLHMVEVGSGAKRSLPDVRLSRYACYLIVQNGDPSKPVIANGQTYFALQTRQQELQVEAMANLSEDEFRLALREKLTDRNKLLVATAKDAGVVTPLDNAIFQDAGYKGLYGGLGAKDIHAKKGLEMGQKILDYMGSVELGANIFRVTQTQDKLRREQVKHKTQANVTHYEVGQKVRKTIEELGGVMPEELPTPDKSIQQVKRKVLKQVKE